MFDVLESLAMTKLQKPKSKRKPNITDFVFYIVYIMLKQLIILEMK